jgi:glycosyltransferase involved in cell wall biosynthesis
VDDGLQQLRRRLDLAGDGVIVFGVHASTTAADVAATVAGLQRCQHVGRIIVFAEADLRVAGIDVVPVSSRAAAVQALFDIARTPHVGFIEAGARVATGSIDRLARVLGRGIAVAGPSTNRASNRQRRPDAPPEMATDAELDSFVRRLALRGRAGVRDWIPVASVDPFCWLARRDLAIVDDRGVHARRGGVAWATAAYVHRPAFATRTPITFTVTDPLVSCILPTRNRPRFAIEAVRNFLAQDYKERELIVVDDSETAIACLLPDDPRIVYLRPAERLTIGEKRNLACQRARGSIIAHFDDDDWYPPTRLSTQVRSLCEAGADLAGSSELHVVDLCGGREWQVTGPRAGWVAGTTFLYRRELWQANPFAPVMVGEDSRLLARATRIVDLRDPLMCVATIHGRNTATTRPAARAWRSSTGVARTQLGDRYAAYVEAAGSAAIPLVSCVMPTRDRPRFVSLALESFNAQSYPMKELIVVDDGRRPVTNLVSGLPGVRYRRLLGTHTIGAKRNVGHALSRGALVCSWDDDDWYSSDRLRYQLGPILYGEADLTGLESAFMMDLATGDVWSATDTLHETIFAGNVAGGTLTYRREIGDRIRFPNANLAEDATWLRHALGQGFRLARLANAGRFIYMRHARNTWRFHPGTFVDARAWRRVAAPAGFDATTWHAYRAAAA